ncbi:MAG: 50S ribosomal protein L35 [Elusimicrobiota bacterium]|nr:50S ribosomal protein L35 [Endomicrobiia bacterium]MDW8165919.1 50S ribosomal protein L35 [Elusimicrobiota bacterium]
MSKKLKSHSGAKKRFKFTKKGKIKHKKAGLRHLLIGMSSKKSRQAKKLKVLKDVNEKVVKLNLPYGN